MKNVFKSQNLLIVLTIVFSFYSCMKDVETDAEKRQKEDQQIKDYVSKNYAGTLPSTSGLYYISELEGTGDTPGDSDYVVINYKGWTLDGKLFDSTDSVEVKANSIVPWFALGGPLKFSMKVNFPGWIETFKNMKAGGKAIAIMPSLLSFNDFIPRKYEIELVEVIHNLSAYERQKINDYVTSKGKNLTDSTSTGIYYFETLTGTGVAPSAGKTASVQFTERLIDGRLIRYTTSGTNYSFLIGTGSVVTGFEEAVVKMKKGGKATVVIPYYRGYGLDVQVNNYNQIVIPWSSTLLYNIELVDVQ